MRTNCIVLNNSKIFFEVQHFRVARVAQFLAAAALVSESGDRLETGWAGCGVAGSSVAGGCA